MSPDLFVGERLKVLGYQPAPKKLWLAFHDGDWGIKVYKSAPGSRSGVFAIRGILKLYGLQKSQGGTFHAKLNAQKELVIDFKRRLYDAIGKKENIPVKVIK